MGWVQRVVAALGLGGGSSPEPERIVFSSSGPIDALVQGILGTPWGRSLTVSRDDALSVAAVKRGRDNICSIGTLPLKNFRGIDEVPSAFLATLDPDVPRVVMLSQTAEDLLCDGISWWRKLALDYRGYPIAARRLAPGSVSLNPPTDRTPAPLPSGQDPRAGAGASVWVDGKEVPSTELVRFDSPNGPLLRHGARTIKRAIVLDMLAGMYAENPRPLDIFTDGDDMSVRAYRPEEVDAFLDKWRTDRRRGGTGYIPKAMKREDVNAPSPAELQLVELQRQCNLELANLMGIDAEEVGVSTTSRSYFNGTDRDRQKINNTLGPFLSALSDRLSMGDVTPRGQAVRWDLTDYLKPDPATQVAYWRGLWDMQAISSAEVRALANISGRPPAPRPTATPAVAAAPADTGKANAITGTIVAGTVPAITTAAPALAQLLAAGARFNDGPALRFSVREFAGAPAEVTVDESARTITGLAVPYNATARKFGYGFRFSPGSLEYDANNLGRIKALKDHYEPVGIHQAVTDSSAGPTVTLHVLAGPDGPIKASRDQLLFDAKHGLYDGLSVGVDFSLDPRDGDVEYDAETRTYTVLRASWRETSVTPMPAFDDARVTSVAASRSGGTMTCQHCNQPHGPGISCQTYVQLVLAQSPQHQLVGAAAATAAPAVPPAQAPSVPAGSPAPAAPPQTFTAEQLTTALNTTVQAMVANGQIAAAPPTAAVVNPHANALPGAPASPAGGQFGMARVNEPSPYRLQRNRRTGDYILGVGSHDFSSDYHAFFTHGDIAAHDRVMHFMRAQFDVAIADIDEVNPTKDRPEMYVDQRDYITPIWDTIYKGTLADITPFRFPKFNTAAGLVAAHTPGTEPTSGTFTTTAQTVTPTGYSGKAKIQREVWDQGGNPMVSTLIWNQMVRGVREALEAAAVTMLNAGSFTALGTITALNADQGRTLFAEIKKGIARLQFARGGNRFRDVFTQADLYLNLADARDTAGAPLVPVYGAMNRDGSAESGWGQLNIGGTPFTPAWALAAEGQTVPTKSYAVDRGDVHGWSSPPQRLTFDQTEVANVYLGVWGYQATAVSDTNGVRTITWDPA